MIDVDACRITFYPAPVLLKPARPVEQVDETIVRLVDKMGDIMVEQKGVGLAAPQAGVGLRLFIVSVDGTKEGLRAYVNPVLKLDGPQEAKEEGNIKVLTLLNYRNCKLLLFFCYLTSIRMIID